MKQSKAYTNLFAFIDSYWDKIIIKPEIRRINRQTVKRVIMRNPHDTNPHVIIVPYTCLVPNEGRFKTIIFYWDSYFMFRGLIDTKHEWVIPEMVENFIYLFKRYGIIPNFSHPSALNRSQPPFLTSMIFDAYAVLKRDKRISSRIKKLFITPNKWLASRMETAKKEYTDIWISSSNHETQSNYNHYVDEFQLNRYGDRDVGYPLLSELESGWDLTSRFYSRCNEFLPIDLNCYLYKYERDFARTARILKKEKDAISWSEKAQKRKNRIVSLMWNEKEGFFYDYDYVHKKQSTFQSLAGFAPLWAGLATVEQAEQMRKKLSLFETDYGLTITDKDSLAWELDLHAIPESRRITIQEIFGHQQWDWPHIWSPMEYMTVIGLVRYGFLDDAKRIMQRAIQANITIFKQYGSLLEKIDATTGGAARNHAYPNQFGFGWTNAAIYRYSQILEALDKKQHIYKTDSQIPPYDLTIPH